MNYLTLLKQAIVENSERTAFVDQNGSRRISYDQLDKLSSKTAGKLHSAISAKSRAIYLVMTCVIAILLAGGICIAFCLGQSGMEEGYLKMVTAVVGMLFASILFACSLNARDDMQQGHALSSISALLVFNLLLTGIFDVLDGKDGMGTALFALQTLSSVISTAVHCLFWIYQSNSLPKNRRQRYYTVWIYGLLLVYLGILMINPFTGILFRLDETGQMDYTGETLEWIFFSAFYLSYLLNILLHRCSLKKKLILASFSVFPLLCLALTMIWSILGVPYPVSSLTYISLLLAAYVVFFGDYIESKDLMLRQKAETAEMKSELMLSQLNPHFVANTLNSIVALCRFDPPEAERATRLFAGYLRENNVDITGNQMIPFDKELKNLKNYVTIEQIRFPDLKVKYDISCTQFLIPAMTMQPLVENAITYGIHGSGLITIFAAEAPDAYVVCIVDSGVGFSEKPLDGRKHIGIANCRNRLQMLCGGNLTIRNRNSGGTECEIVIPKEGKENENTLH